MGMHVSLTDELEKLVQNEVKTGMFQNASEVVRAALRDYFHRPKEVEVMALASELIREARKEGKYQQFHDESVMDDMMSEVFGK